MSTARFESQIKQIPHPQQAVYNMLSNLENIGKIQDRVPQDRVRDMTFDRDSVSVRVEPIGQLRLRVCERQEPKCVKFVTEQSPVPFTVWIQMLPVTASSSKMRVTAEADLNPLIKAMVEKQLQTSVDEIANGLAAIDYEQ